MEKKDKRPTKIYPERRERPMTTPVEIPAGDAVITEPVQPPIRGSHSTPTGSAPV